MDFKPCIDAVPIDPVLDIFPNKTCNDIGNKIDHLRIDIYWPALFDSFDSVRHQAQGVGILCNDILIEVNRSLYTILEDLA